MDAQEKIHAELEKMHEEFKNIALVLEETNARAVSNAKELHLIAVAITAVSFATFAVAVLFLAYGMLVYTLA